MTAANGSSLDEIKNWPFISDKGRAFPWRWDQQAVPKRSVTNYQATQHNVQNSKAIMVHSRLLHRIYSNPVYRHISCWDY
jgi:hypothetical protein